jgi:20S proteasome alpha/beta subunit
VNVLLGGYDEATSTPHLYWIDYLGTMAEVPYAAHGYGAYFALSTLDRFVISRVLDIELKVIHHAFENKDIMTQKPHWKRV